MIVYGAAAEESVARLYAAGVIPGLMIAGDDRDLCDVARQAGELRRGRAVRPQTFPARDRAQPVGAGRAGHHPRRHLWRRVFADRGRRRGLRLCGAGHRLRVPRARLARHRRSRRLDRDVHRPDPDHRRLRRRVRLAADRQPGAGDGDGLAAIAERLGLDAAAGDQRAAAGWSAASSIRCRRSCCSARCWCRS